MTVGQLTVGRYMHLRAGTGCAYLLIAHTKKNAYRPGLQAFSVLSELCDSGLTGLRRYCRTYSSSENLSLKSALILSYCSSVGADAVSPEIRRICLAKLSQRSMIRSNPVQNSEKTLLLS